MDPKNNKQKRIRIGFLLGSTSVPAWKIKMIERVQALNQLDIFFYVVEIENGKRSLLKQFLSCYQYIVFKLYSKLDKKLFNIHPNSLKLIDISYILKKHQPTFIKASSDTNGIKIRKEDLKKIEQHVLDVLVSLIADRLNPDIINSIPEVWYYKFGDHELTLRDSAGFFEVMTQKGTTSSALMRLTNNQSVDQILYQSFSLTDNRSVYRNMNKIYWKSALFVPRKLEELLRVGFHVFNKRVSAQNSYPRFCSEKLYHNQDLHNLSVIKLLVSLLIRYVKENLSAFVFKNRWGLLYKKDKGLAPLLSEYEKIFPPKDRYYADPFVVKSKNKHYIFFEEVIYKNKKGHISVMEMDQQGNIGEPIKVLEKPYHLSYPFIFKYQNDFYMIPESAQNETIELYKSQEFPYKWAFKMNLMEKIKAYDTTLFFYHDKWWLFANVVEIPGVSILDELFLFYADTFFTQQWKPHPMNPIVSDCRNSRPAGRIFQYNGHIIRPSQNSSKRYGYGVNLHEIITLNEEIYEEVAIQAIKPKWDEKIKAIHTMNHAENFVIVDAILR